MKRATGHRSGSRWAAWAVTVVLAGCGGSTGGDVLFFTAAAAGPADAPGTGELEFVNDRGWHVLLTTATLHVGALYLVQSEPVSGVGATACVLPSTYVAEVIQGLDVDLLSARPQRFPALGRGTTTPALAGQVWLTTGDVNQVSPRVPILKVEGTADKEGDVRPFTASISIAGNRVSTSSEGAAGADPICAERIVSPILTSVVVEPGGGLLLRVDTPFLFTNADFAELQSGSDGYVFSDEPSDSDPASTTFYSQPSANLFDNLKADGPPYAFSWDPSL